MATLVERLKQALSSSSDQSNIAQVFRIAPLSLQEKEKVGEILNEHRQEKHEISTDLKMLSDLTAEIKAITCQAAILHGERIKKLKRFSKAIAMGPSPLGSLPLTAIGKLLTTSCSTTNFINPFPKPLHRSSMRCQGKSLMRLLAEAEVLKESSTSSKSTTANPNKKCCKRSARPFLFPSKIKELTTL